MTSTLPPDPYQLLGVAKDAKLAEIRSAHRKLVLKCHPDKVQDAALKAIKVDEFQKVQQAYELLSDETRRVQYDEQVKLFELRKEMGRGNPTARSNPFEYEVKTAEPRSDSFVRPQPSSKYTYSTTGAPPRSHSPEDSRRAPRKPTSFEDRDRKRSSREDEARRDAHLRKLQEEEEQRARMREKEAKRHVHKDTKKSRDKERKRGSEEKASRTRGAYVEEDSSDEYRRTPPRSSETKSSRHKASMEEEIRIRNEDSARADEARKAPRAHESRVPGIKEAPLDPKWNEHMEYAGAYMQAARRKVTVEDAPHVPPAPYPGMMRRAETFAAPSSGSYTVRYAAAPTAQYSDDEMPRRSSTKKDTRRTSDTPSTRKRSKERERRGSPSRSRDPYIVEAASATLPGSRKPSLQTHSSAPPQSFTREMPSRSKTEYPAARKEPVPGMSRAHTFSESHNREGGSRLKQEISSDSESDAPSYPPPTSRRAPQTTRYVVQESRVHPVAANTSRHRSDLRDLNEYPRERSESPRGNPTRYFSDRPTVAVNPPPSEHLRTTSRVPPAYYAPNTDVPEPVIVSARPKMSAREQGSHRSASYAPPTTVPFNKVNYAQQYTTDQVVYATDPVAKLYDSRRAGRDPDNYYNPHSRSGREHPVYAQ